MVYRSQITGAIPRVSSNSITGAPIRCKEIAVILLGTPMIAGELKTEAIAGSSNKMGRPQMFKHQVDIGAITEI